MEENGWKHYLRLILNIVIPFGGWAAACLLGPKLLTFFMPFVIGWILAMIANPLARFLENRVNLVRRHSSMVIVGTALALVIGLLYLLISRSFLLLRRFILDLPELYASMEGEIAKSTGQLERLFMFLPDSLRESLNQFTSNLGSHVGTLVEKVASPTVEAAGSVAKSLPAALVYTVVTILSAYFFIVDRERILEIVRHHTPQWAFRYVLHLKGQTRRLIGGYFMAQFKIMAVVWLILTVGFVVLGVGYSPLWAFLIAFLDFLPVLGTGTALIPWGLVKLLGGEYAFAAGLLLIYVLTQVIRQMIQPKLVGDTMGLPPLMTLFLLYLGFKAGGLAGMILAVPMGLIVMNLYHFGAFQGMTDSFLTLAADISRFRKEGGQEVEEREK